MIIMEPEIKTDIYFKKRQLTPKETEIMNLLAKGLLDKEMAYTLGLSLYTVKNHLKNIYHKLNVNNRLEAVIWYYQKRPIEWFRVQGLELRVEG
jgi:DNA-binding NarL/FixJ family response regulator